VSVKDTKTHTKRTVTLDDATIVARRPTAVLSDGSAPTAVGWTKVFENLHETLDKLDKISNPTALQAKRDILTMTKAWATTAIDAARLRAASANKIAQATAAVSRGDDKASCCATAAIEAYQDAFKKATSA
jgi:hypothetical protein